MDFQSSSSGGTLICIFFSFLLHQMRIKSISWRCSTWLKRWRRRPAGPWCSSLTAWATCTPCTSSTSSPRPGKTDTSKLSSVWGHRGPGWPRPSVCSHLVRDEAGVTWTVFAGTTGRSSALSANGRREFHTWRNVAAGVACWKVGALSSSTSFFVFRLC